MPGIYVHIPFCRGRCAYCAFASTTLGGEAQAAYIEALGLEMTQRLGSEPVVARTLYIGGGTPSALTEESFEGLWTLFEQHITLKKEAEVTFEVNPDDVTPSFVSRLTRTPVNRISMGVQSLSDSMLRRIGRRHTAEQALRAVRLLQEAGYGNISVDLMYGLPGQPLAAFEADLQTLLQTGVPHLSAYAMQVEEETPMERLVQQVALPDDEMQSLQYDTLRSLCRSFGLAQYEISNFAKPGYHSRHNSSYWTGVPYVGLGLGAHSYDGHALRRANTIDMDAYLAEAFLGEEEHLSEADRRAERIMLSLRTAQGLCLSSFEREFGPVSLTKLLADARPHIASGRLVQSEGCLRLAPEALFVSNGIVADLM